jgi:hypothetical protein
MNVTRGQDDRRRAEWVKGRVREDESERKM